MNTLGTLSLWILAHSLRLNRTTAVIAVQSATNEGQDAASSGRRTVRPTVTTHRHIIPFGN